MSGGHYTAAVRYYGHPMADKSEHAETNLPHTSENNANSGAHGNNSKLSRNQKEEGAPAGPDIEMDSIPVNADNYSTAVSGTHPVDDSATASTTKASDVAKKGIEPEPSSREPKSKKGGLQFISNLFKDVAGCSSSRGLDAVHSGGMYDRLTAEQKSKIPKYVGQVGR